MQAFDQWWKQRLSGVSAYRYGERTADARSAHAADTTEWRREIACNAFNPADHQRLFDLLREGHRLDAAAAAVGVTRSQVYGRTLWDLEFAAALEEVLAETCPAGDYCGTSQGTKYLGHCHACRTAHHCPRTTPS